MAYENKTGLPSVTTILRPWIASDYYTEDSKWRGQDVHSALASYLNVGFCLTLNRPEWQGYVDSGKRWIDAYVTKVIFAEKELGSTALGYSGHPDLCCEAPKIDDEAGIVDWKTGIASALWHPLQVAAYRYLSYSQGWPSSWGGILRLRPDGKMAIFDRCKDYYSDMNKFNAALVLHQHFNGG